MNTQDKNIEWRPVPEYEDHYEVSNVGDIRSIPRKGSHGFPIKGGILIGFINRNGYRLVLLYKDRKRKHNAVHRILAKTFVHNPNPQEFDCVNHIDENTLNNSADNLEWCTHKYNNNYGNRNKRISKAQRNNIRQSKPVLQYTKEGEFVKEWPSVKKIKRQTNMWDGSIQKCCRGEHKTAYGYIWKYKQAI